MTAPALDYGSGGRIGVLLPSVNQAAEPQLRAMLPADIAIAVTRLKLVDSSEASLLGMARDVEPAAELLADAGVDIVVFHCTAVSTYSTELEASILARIQSATGLPCVATSQALVAALQALPARRVVLLSPYTAAVNDREAAYFAEHGFEILGNAGLDCRTGREMMAIAPQAWHAFATRHAHARADAYVLSCTTVRTAETIEALERSLGRPVVTSNTAVAWYCMRKLGALPGFQATAACWPAPEHPDAVRGAARPPEEGGVNLTTSRLGIPALAPCGTGSRAPATPRRRARGRQGPSRFRRLRCRPRSRSARCSAGRPR